MLTVKFTVCLGSNGLCIHTFIATGQSNYGFIPMERVMEFSKRANP